MFQAFFTCSAVCLVLLSLEHLGVPGTSLHRHPLRAKSTAFHLTWTRFLLAVKIAISRSATKPTKPPSSAIQIYLQPHHNSLSQSRDKIHFPSLVFYSGGVPFRQAERMAFRRHHCLPYQDEKERVWRGRGISSSFRLSAFHPCPSFSDFARNSRIQGRVRDIWYLDSLTSSAAERVQGHWKSTSLSRSDYKFSPNIV